MTFPKVTDDIETKPQISSKLQNVTHSPKLAEALGVLGKLLGDVDALAALVEELLELLKGRVLGQRLLCFHFAERHPRSAGLSLFLGCAVGRAPSA